MADVKRFNLPDVGEGLTEADIVTWKVKPGDRVSVNQVIVEIETAKSLVELPSPFDGVVTDLLVPEGQSVDVGTPIISVDVSADASAGAATAAESGPHSAVPAGTTPSGTAPTTQAEDVALAEVNEPSAGSQAAEDLVPSPAEEGAREPGIEGSPAPKIERQAVLVGYGVKLGTTTRRARKGRGAGGGSGGGRLPEEPVATSATGNGSAAAPEPERPMAKPPVRKLAKDLGVDLAALTGSGPEGTITREDVQAAAAAPETAGARAAQPALAVVTGGEERIPIKGVRKHTAAAVTASAFTAPHVTEFLQIDVTETMTAVQRLRELPEFEGLPVRPLLFVAKALMLAVERHPMINSSW